LEARLEHLRVPPRDDVWVSAVRHDGEPVGLDREIALVRLHGRDDHALGELKEPLVETTLENMRLLDELDHLGELAAGVAPVPEGVEPRDDLAAPLLGDRLDVSGAQRLDVRGGARDLDRAVGKTVPEAGLPDDRLLV